MGEVLLLITYLSFIYTRCMAKETSIEALRKEEGRGGLLTALMALFVIALVYHFVQTIVAHADIISLFLQAIILFGLWKWRKIAVYGFFVFYTGILVLMLFVFSSYAMVQVVVRELPLGWIALGIVAYIAILCLFFWAIKHKWHLFR